MTAPASTTERRTAAPRPGSHDVADGGWVADRRLELAGYAAVSVALVALLLWHVRNVDGYYLDEWLYTHGSETMWNDPGAIVGEISNWTRGPQRLYSLLLAPLWGLLGTSAAYTASHVLNTLLLVSTVLPAALLARRIAVAPLLRVLGVALGVGVPWLVISANLLTENLAFPLLAWSVYAIVVAAESPTVLNQLAAVAVIGALALTRLNLAVMAGVLVIAVVAADLLALRERRGIGPRRRVLAIARRRAPLLVVGGVALVAVLLRPSGAADFGSYGGFAGEGFLEDKWAQRDVILTQAWTYTRGVVTGTFVLPFVLGVAGALGAVRGVFGARARIAGLVVLACTVGVILVVAVWTVGVVYEERYVFYVCAPLAVFGVAAIAHLRRLLPELVVASAVAVWALSRTSGFPNGASSYYFAAPGAAFWSRVMEYRLVLAERRFLGWLPGETNWRPVAAALLLLIVLVAVAAVWRTRRRWLELLVGGGLALTFVAQVLALDYDYKKVLYGPVEAAGGLAGAPGHGDRGDWIDEALPSGASAALVPPSIGPFAGLGAAETIEFWNRSLDAVVALRFTGAGVPAPPGYAIVDSKLEGGLATWEGPAVGFIAGQADDPRVQFAGSPVPGAPPPFEIIRLRTPPAAVWTATGLEADLYLLEDRRAEMTLARDRAPGVRSVVLTLQAPDSAPGPLAWRLAGADGERLSGRLRAGRRATLRLRVPACPARGDCAPVTWRLSATGRATSISVPRYGGPDPARPVTLQLQSARLERR